MCKVFIVEDDSTTRKILEKQLIQINHKVIGFSDRGENLLEVLKEAEPDVVLMDIHLKGELNGIQCAHQINTDLHIPVIYTTGDTRETIEHAAIESNPYGFLIKPFNKDDLKVAIDMALHKQQVTKKLYAEKDFAETIINNVSDAVIITDTEGVIQSVNKAAGTLFACSENILIGRPLSSFLDKETGPKTEIATSPMQIKDKGGKQKDILRSRALIKNKEETVTHFVETLTDVTKCKEAERLADRIKKEMALREKDALDFINWREMYASKDLRVFEKTMYALNTSLNSIGGPMLLDFIMESITKKDDLYCFDEEIYDILCNLNKSLYPLLTNLANIEEFINSDLELEEISLREVMDLIFSSIEKNEKNMQLKNNKIEIIHLPDNYNHIRLEVNTTYLAECIDELIINSIKYSPENEIIWIDIEEKDQGVTLRFSNKSEEFQLVNETLTGVPYEYSELVFAPFERLNRNLKYEYEEKWSFGLGLYVVRKILEKMKAKICCNNAIDYIRMSTPRPITVFTVTFNNTVSRRSP